MAINRVTKVVKGGKNLSFSALVVIGDPSAKVVGYGVGKAKEVPSAIRKGIEAAKKNLRRVNVLDTTIPHQVLGWFAQLAGAAEAGPGRNRRDRGRRGARGDHGLRHPQRADQVDRPAQSAQRGEGDHRGARIAARQERRRGNARPGGGETANGMEGTIKIKLVRSPICTPEKHKRVVQRPGTAQAEPDGGAAGHARYSAAWSRRFRICWKWWSKDWPDQTHAHPYPIRRL